MSITVVEPGIATTVQDRGRAGMAHVGVPRSGVIDPGVAGIVNRAVGNPPAWPVIESAGGLVLRAERHLLIATSQHDAPIALRPGQTVSVRADGLRQWQYVAVRGGVDVAPVLGSCSHDTLSGLGPPPLVAGAMLGVGSEHDGPVAEVVAVRSTSGRARFWPGPRADWFTGDVLDVVAGSSWTVTTSSRVGVRLTGPALERVVPGELPSEGLVRGAVQVPPDGDPIMMLADHPTTGGYPVVAVVDPDDVAAVAQTVVGGTVSFRRAG